LNKSILAIFPKQLKCSTKLSG